MDIDGTAWAQRCRRNHMEAVLKEMGVEHYDRGVVYVSDAGIQL